MMTSKECWALLHTKGFSLISFDWGSFNIICSETSRWRQRLEYWVLDDICKVFAPIAAPCTAITSPPCVFCIALSIVCLHWMDLCTLVKVIYIFYYLGTQWFLLCFLYKIFTLILWFISYLTVAETVWAMFTSCVHWTQRLLFERCVY